MPATPHPSADRKIGKSEIAAWFKGQASDLLHHMRSASGRSAASINLGALLVVTVTAAIWQPDLRWRSRSTEQTKPLAAAPAAVKIVGATPRGKECSEQTWPYIERQCLSYASAGANTDMTFPPAPSTATPVNAPDARVAAVPPASNPPVARQVAPETAQPAPGVQSAASTGDAGIADDADDYQPMTEEEVRAMARAEARHRRMMRTDFFRHGHFHLGPFRF